MSASLLLVAGALALATGQAAAAPLSHGAYRTARMCEANQPGFASCAGIRLVAKSLTGAELKANAVRQSDEAEEGARPAVTNKSPLAGGLTPQSLHAAYALALETLAGQAQTIGIVDAYNDPTAETDLTVYDAQFGLPACTSANGCFKKLDEQGKTSPLPSTSGEWATEISLDVQMAHTICEDCKIVLVEANDSSYVSLGTAVNAAVKAGATVVSNSYGGPEESGDAGLMSSYYNHPGVPILASSGDCGYRDQACSGNASNFPAGASDVIAVGGTHLVGSEGTWTSTVWEDAGSDCSTIFSAPSWQSALSNFSDTGCGGKRASADVSAVADPYTGVDVYDSTPGGKGYPTGWGVWGGTSAASPIVAAEFGLAGGAHGVSYPATTLYSNVGDAQALTDVVSGHNGSCSNASICKAESGYDGPTGVGSPVGLDAFFPGSAPQSSAAPTISGTAEQGQTLSVGPGTWTGEPSAVAEQWLRCGVAGASCKAIAGATKSTYTLASADVGATVRVQESASNGSGAGAPALSQASAKVVSNLPTIASFSPTSGPTGSTVTIVGTHLSAATAVHFGSLKATFKAVSTTKLEATVPSGFTSGAIAVITPAKTVTASGSFKATLSIASFSPQTAFAGKPVTVTGIGFNAGSTVYFGETPVTTTHVSATTLRATVPANAATAPITVVNQSAPLGSVTSAVSFALAKTK